MMRDTILAATMASGLILPARAELILPPRPAIVKPGNLEMSANLLAMPVLGRLFQADYARRTILNSLLLLVSVVGLAACGGSTPKSEPTRADYVDAVMGAYSADRVPITRSEARCFVERSPFVCVATARPDGGLDVSPRGDPAGFVRILDDRRLLIPDATGNRRLDVLHRIVENGEVSLLFLIPGGGETLRVRGSACVTRDAELLDGLETGGKPARLGIGVTVETAFLHCAKAFIRSGLWQPDAWPDASGLARPAQIWADHVALPGLDVDELAEYVADGYANDI